MRASFFSHSLLLPSPLCLVLVVRFLFALPRLSLLLPLAHGPRRRLLLSNQSKENVCPLYPTPTPDSSQSFSEQAGSSCLAVRLAPLGVGLYEGPVEPSIRWGTCDRYTRTDRQLRRRALPGPPALQ
eukprot:763659-Hanusia_phi.AAC.3